MSYSIRIYDKNFGGNSGGLGSIIGIPGMGAPGGRPGGGSPGPGGGMNPSNGKKNLQELSSQTGGAYFEVGKKETLDQIYGKIEEELRSQYSLGHAPDANAAKGYRRVRNLRKSRRLENHEPLKAALPKMGPERAKQQSPGREPWEMQSNG